MSRTARSGASFRSVDGPIEKFSLFLGKIQTRCFLISFPRDPDDVTTTFLVECCSFFDRLIDQMIWSEYQEVGYRSLFLEESPSFGLYHYHLKGFKRTPADYYSYPLLKSLEKSPLRHNTGELKVRRFSDRTRSINQDSVSSMRTSEMLFLKCSR